MNLSCKQWRSRKFASGLTGSGSACISSLVVRAHHCCGRDGGLLGSAKDVGLECQHSGDGCETGGVAEGYRPHLCKDDRKRVSEDNDVQAVPFLKHYGLVALFFCMQVAPAEGRRHWPRYASSESLPKSSYVP